MKNLLQLLVHLFSRRQTRSIEERNLAQALDTQELE